MGKTKQDKTLEMLRRVTIEMDDYASRFFCSRGNTYPRIHFGLA